MIFDLATVWAGLIALAILLYVMLDGFDLGVGILFPVAGDEDQQDQMMNSVAPVWDGNETWLVLGGGGLFAVFPLAYAIAMPALYMPVTVMLLALVFRGVAFEFRGRTQRWRRLWSRGFFAGSLIAALMQGIALGAIVQGIQVADRAYAGGWWDWLTPFSLLTGIALVTGYALLGSTWLVLKTVGPLHDRMQHLARYLGLATLGFIGAVSLATPFVDPAYFERWFDWPASAWTMIVPLLVILAAMALFRGLRNGSDLTPFLASLSFFVLGFAGIGISFYPNMLPPSVPIAAAAAPDTSLAFALVGAVIMLPVILIYTGYAYWVFRGKVRPGEGYH